MRTLTAQNFPSVVRKQLEHGFPAQGHRNCVPLISGTGKVLAVAVGCLTVWSDVEAQAAITALNEHEFGGRTLTVNEVRPAPKSYR